VFLCLDLITHALTAYLVSLNVCGMRICLKLTDRRTSNPLRSIRIVNR